jgi:septal ring factor EnvC (AmiA/AmiB activator)
MSGEDSTRKFTNADGSLSGDDLLQAVRLDMNSLFELVRSLDAKVDTRLHDTRPMWETVLARFDTVDQQLKGQGAELKGQGARFDGIEAELRRLRRKIERMVGELSHNVIEMRVDQQDLEDRIEKLEDTPA